MAHSHGSDCGPSATMAATELCDHQASPCHSGRSLNQPVGPTQSLLRAGQPVGTKEALEKPRQNRPLNREYVSFSLHGNPGGGKLGSPLL